MEKDMEKELDEMFEVAATDQTEDIKIIVEF